MALALGVLLALAMNVPGKAACRGLAKWLLQVCVVMLGFGMDLQMTLHAGAAGATFAAVSIGLTLLLGFSLGRRLKIRSGAAALISVGTAICGGSAIAAVGSAIDAEESDMTVAMGVVFLLNAAALYVFPPLGHALQLTGPQFGTWAGIAIHDVSSVVAAADRFGAGAVATATAVKLSRALWIVPLTLAITAAHRRRMRLTNATFGFDAAGQTTRGKIQIPWFIGLFLLASVCRSFVPGITTLAPQLGHLATSGLTLTLLLIGTALSPATLKAVGIKALLLGTALWLVVSAASLLVVFHM